MSTPYATQLLLSFPHNLTDIVFSSIHLSTQKKNIFTQLVMSLRHKNIIRFTKIKKNRRNPTKDHIKHAARQPTTAIVTKELKRTHLSPRKIAHWKLLLLFVLFFFVNFFDAVGVCYKAFIGIVSR